MTRPSRPFVALLLLATILLLYVAYPFRTPLFLAVVIAAVLHDPLERLTIALRGRRTIASALVTLAVFVLIVAPFAALVGFVTRESAAGLAYLRETLGVSSVSELRGIELPVALQRILEVLHLDREQVFDAVSRLVEIVQGALPEIVASGSRAVLATAIMLIALYFLLLDGSRVVQWAWRVSPLDARQTQELTAEMRRVTRATVIGILATAVFQGVAAGAGYLFAGIPHAAFFGLLTATVSFVPGVGTSLVWAPASVSLWMGGRPIAAVALALFCLVVVVGAEQVGKPLLMRGQVQMHTGLIFLSLLGGLAMFGLLGVLLGPLIVAFFLAMMRIYERDFRASDAPPIASDRAA
ncbi:MAG: AI-2E family transporter [Deltaproteobacteria bacterium]|nr:MAG: AI-2E family transporter [Deltaproteobacteria bacterium]